MRSRFVSLAPLLMLAACSDADTSASPSSPADPSPPVTLPDGAPNPAARDAGAPLSEASAPPMTAPAGLVFGPYKDVGIDLDWNTNVFSSAIGTKSDIGAALVAHGGKTVTLAFATGECGSESWAGLSGDVAANANAALLQKSGASYILSTGGAAGQFTCGSDEGFEKFLARWTGKSLVGVDFDIEAGQTPEQIDALVSRVVTAHAKHPSLRFSFTLATLAGGGTGSTAASLGASAPDGFNVLGDEVLAALKKQVAEPTKLPGWITIDLMVMDYGGTAPSNCVVANGKCDMGQSAIQAALDLHDHFGVPFANIELTPMIGGNDAVEEKVRLEDVDTLATFAIKNGLAGVHYWSFDRDRDCATGWASSTCNTMGEGYAGDHGFLKRFLAAGLK